MIVVLIHPLSIFNLNLNTVITNMAIGSQGNKVMSKLPVLFLFQRVSTHNKT